MNWQRHQLVWLSAAGWQAVLAGWADEPPWTEAARDCLQHWADRDLPLVVTRQPAALIPLPSGEEPRPSTRLTLGLAAPLRWQRQRLFVRVAPSAVRRVGAFPPAEDIATALPVAARADWRALCAGLRGAGVEARVHGSHGWQALSGWACVREGVSDIDLLLSCATPAQADAATLLLTRAQADLPRLDGECLFGDGTAAAWREWAAWRAGATRQLLVKRLHGAVLEDADRWAVAA